MKQFVHLRAVDLYSHGRYFQVDSKKIFSKKKNLVKNYKFINNVSDSAKTLTKPIQINFLKVSLKPTANQ